jgi:hypothetical protein
MIPIDKGIPLPGKYPFDKMEVGDSFLVPAHIPRTTATAAATRYGKSLGMKFSFRITPEGLRCWRVE